jgi:hypothetical protein
MSPRSVELGAAAFVAVVALGSGATASQPPVPVVAGATHPASTSGLTRVCHEQLDSDNPQAIISQNFQSSFDAYDSQGADDFVLRRPCRLRAVSATGTYFGGSGPLSSVNVTIYRARHGEPGRVVRQVLEAAYADSCGGNGCPTIAMKGRLGKGRYWLSVQGTMDFSAGGEWGWSTNNTVRGKAAMWQNPGDGFLTGCTTYGDLLTCLPIDEGGDLAFSLGTATHGG